MERTAATGSDLPARAPAYIPVFLTLMTGWSRQISSLLVSLVSAPGRAQGTDTLRRTDLPLLRLCEQERPKMLSTWLHLPQ